MHAVAQNGSITVSHDQYLKIETSNNFKNGKAKLSKYIMYIMSLNLVMKAYPIQFPYLTLN